MKNSQRRIMRGRNTLMVPSQQHADWHRDMSLLLAPLGPPVPIESRDVAIALYAPDRRSSDLSNKAESIMDQTMTTQHDAPSLQNLEGCREHPKTIGGAT